jgi:uncharacterized protein (DUF302 family)
MDEPSQSAEVAADGIVNRRATDPVAVVVERLLAALDSRNIEVFAVVDHSGAAARVGQDLRDTKLVIFGNPAVGTGVIRAVPVMGLDLPLKILVWAGDGGQTNVTYNEPSFLARRYGISQPDQLRVRSSVEVLADVIVRPTEG